MKNTYKHNMIKNKYKKGMILQTLYGTITPKPAILALTDVSWKEPNPFSDSGIVTK